MKLAVGICPTPDAALTNCLYVKPEVAKQLDKDFDETYNKSTYVNVSYNGNNFIFAIRASPSPKLSSGKIGFNATQRKWAGVVKDSTVDVTFHDANNLSYIGLLSLEIGVAAENTTTFDSEKMAKEVLATFKNLPHTTNQEYVFRFGKEGPIFTLKVKDMVLTGESHASAVMNVGRLAANAEITFDPKEDSGITMTGTAVGSYGETSNVINPDWDFSQMGIGGMDEQFKTIFRRAFASRVFPPKLIDQLGLHHVKGILLHGPPGTGKTLMARQIGNMLKSKEPKIVNGPEILNMYVGKSEENIRALFVDAESDQKEFGINSDLHMIIFDEIDAICKQRGNAVGSTGVNDTVVNQLLSKIDGVEQLNNILIIGMTNRKDMIDEALLRPGRLEVQIEISLPDEEGRRKILEIHTAKLSKANKLGPDVDLQELAEKTKNYSGAEIAGLVRAASTSAMNEWVKIEGKVMVDKDATDNLVVKKEFFLNAIENDIKPKFGTGNEDSIDFLANGIIEYGAPITEILAKAMSCIKQTEKGELNDPVTVLLQGVEGSGKTALAAHIAYKLSGFPCVKMCTPEKMVGYSETAKCLSIKQIFDDARKSSFSCVILDDIERLLNYFPVGPKFSNIVLQSLIVLLKKNLKKGERLLIIGTTCLKEEELKTLQLLKCFSNIVDVPAIADAESLINMLDKSKNVDLTDERSSEIRNTISKIQPTGVSIKRLMSFIELAKEAEEKEFVSKLFSLIKHDNKHSEDDFLK